MQGTAQLGDLLFSKPGITGSTFAPGAASRPIIRGLDVNRVGILENGNDAGGASDLGEDHFVPIDPLATNQVEVIRGPDDDAVRIDLDRRRCQRDQQSHFGCVAHLPRRRSRPMDSPRRLRWRTCNRRHCVTVETRTAVNSVDRGVEGGILLDTGDVNFAVPRRRLWPQGRRLQYSGLSVSVRPDPAGQRPAAEFGVGRRMVGRSAARTSSTAASSALRSRRTTRPTASPASTPPITGPGSTRRQTKFTAKGEYRPDAAAIDADPLLGGRHQLSHNQIALADPADPSTARRPANIHQQGAGGPRRSPADAVQRALCDGDDGLRTAGKGTGTDGAKPRRSTQSAQRPVRSEHEHRAPATFSTS